MYLFNMNKKTLLILLISSSILLLWCSSSKITKIEFDKFEFNMKSNQEYEINKHWKESPNIISFKEIKTEESDIPSSIIIINQNTNVNIKKFVDDNINKTKSSIASFELKDTNTLSFNCSGTKISWVIKDFTIIENWIENYYAQYFFINEYKWYIISFSSNDNDKKDDFKKSLNSLYCKK